MLFVVPLLNKYNLWNFCSFSYEICYTNQPILDITLGTKKWWIFKTYRFTHNVRIIE